MPDETIAQSLGVGGSTVYDERRLGKRRNIQKALQLEPRPGAARKLTGQEEALLVATACSRPPAGRARWTIELLAGEMVRLTDHKTSRDGAPALGRERAQTLAREDVVRAEDRWRVRRPYGGRARSLRRAARSGAPGGIVSRTKAPFS